MRIGIDARVLDRQITGTGRFLINILNELPNQDKDNKYYLFSNLDHGFDANFYTFIQTPSSFLPEKVYSPIYLNFVLPKILKINKIDVLFEPNVLLPIIGIKNIKKISVVHDVILKIYKELYPFSYRAYLSLFLPVSLKKSDMVLTVSECSKMDINRIYNVDYEKIKVIYNTASTIFKPCSINEIQYPECLMKMALPKKYLLYVGVFDKRKNISALFKIMDILKEKGSPLKLVMIGKGGYNFQKVKIEMEKRKDCIQYYDSVDDSVMKYLYNYSFAFVFPSLYEGFGIPPLEAMQSGTPVVSSNSSSLREVIGNGGLLNDPNDYSGFANDILRLESDPIFYSEMKERAVLQAKKFNISTITKELVDLFNIYKS